MIASSGAPMRVEPRNNDSMTVATGNPVKHVAKRPKSLSQSDDKS
jgi:hypothetical protein